MNVGLLAMLLAHLLVDLTSYPRRHRLLQQLQYRGLSLSLGTELTRRQFHGFCDRTISYKLHKIMSFYGAKMARPRKSDSWLPADGLRIKVWYRALMKASLSAMPNAKGRSADLQRFLEMKEVDIASSRLTDWKLGRCMPSKGRLLAIQKINDDLAKCERLLNNSPVVTDNQLSNLLITLDTVGSAKNMTLQCMDIIRKLAAPWIPRADMSHGAAWNWRVPKLRNSVIDASIARQVNILDPLSILTYSLYVADAIIAPCFAACGVEAEEQPERWSSLALVWGFDVLCMSMLINRLVNRDLSFSEGELLSRSADYATLLRRVLLGEIPVANMNRLMSIFKGSGLPCNLPFVTLIAGCAKSIESALSDYGVSLADVKGYLLFPMDNAVDRSFVSKPSVVVGARLKLTSCAH